MAGGSRLDREEGVELLLDGRGEIGQRHESFQRPVGLSNRRISSAMSCVACSRSHRPPSARGASRPAPGCTRTFPLATTDSVMSRSVRIPLRPPPGDQDAPDVVAPHLFAASITDPSARTSTGLGSVAISDPYGVSPLPHTR
jgi:hypothetical protein